MCRWKSIGHENANKEIGERKAKDKVLDCVRRPIRAHKVIQAGSAIRASAIRKKSNVMKIAI